MVSLESYLDEQLICSDYNVLTFSSYFLACSLAIHPDKVRVASGQTAGVDKDGKVNKSQSTD